MTYQESRKQQIARQLGVSVRVLEQYLQHKRAEVTEASPAVTPKIAPFGRRGPKGEPQT